MSPFSAAAPLFVTVTTKEPAPGTILVMVICASLAPRLDAEQRIAEATVHNVFVIVSSCEAAAAVVRPVNVPTPALAETVTAAPA